MENNMSDKPLMEEWFAYVCDHRCGMVGLYRAMYEDPDEAQERLASEMCENCPLMKIYKRFME